MTFSWPSVFVDSTNHGSSQLQVVYIVVFAIEKNPSVSKPTYFKHVAVQGSTVFLQSENICAISVQFKKQNIIIIPKIRFVALRVTVLLPEGSGTKILLCLESYAMPSFVSCYFCAHFQIHLCCWVYSHLFSLLCSSLF